jgi:hypothetical protein
MAEITDPRAWITRVASAYMTPAALPAPEGRDTVIGAGPAATRGPAAAGSNGATADGPPRAEDISLEEYLPPTAGTPTTGTPAADVPSTPGTATPPPADPPAASPAEPPAEHGPVSHEPGPVTPSADENGPADPGDQPGS